MALTLRKRGKVWHARGTVRVGRETITVPEFSTGCVARSDAEAVADVEAAKLRAEAIDGPAGRAKRVTIADCLLSYARRPGGVRARDKQPIASLNDFMGARPLIEAPAAWRDWVNGHTAHAPATLARYRTILAAALRHGASDHGIDAPKLPTVKEPRVEPVPVLSEDERARLLASYNPWAARPVLLLAYQGMRTGEVLRLDWRDVDMARQSIHVRAEGAKSGKGRALPMHPRVAEMVAALREERGRPQTGVVFLSQRGVPYADQREEGGGNPLARAHETACRRAGVTGFRIHDWRHDWAARMVMAGVDLYSLMRLGGWSSLRMVQRYAAVSAEHLRDAARKIA